MATITSAQAGNWSATTTWTGGILPVAADQVEISHTVVMDLNSTTEFGRININTGGSLIHADGTTLLCCAKLLYVNGGRYEMKAGSTLKFHATSKTSGTEGQMAGLQVNGTVASQLVCNGSVPLPETSLTVAVALGDAILNVADGTGFSSGEYIAVYYDSSLDTSWSWSELNKAMNDEGFIVHKVSGNNIYIRQRVAITGTLTQAGTSGTNYVYVDNPRKWQSGFKVILDNSVLGQTEIMTISSVDEVNNKLIFTTNLTMNHDNNSNIIETGAQITHAIGHKVYKIATILVADSSAGSNQITIANASMIAIGDKVAIEGYTRANGKEIELGVSNKSGNILTLDGSLPYSVSIGFIVTKTNRDCVITSTDPSNDQNRWYLYYVHGSSYANKKCVMRYVEMSHFGNSYTSVYQGISIRGYFDRNDNEKEIRGCVVKDGWSIDMCGLTCYTGHYIHFRNNVSYRCYNGIYLYDSNGSSAFNNLSFGALAYGVRSASTYYYNMVRYNIAVNSNWSHYVDALYTGTHPWWHNIFKHSNYSILCTISALGAQNGWVLLKNSYQDYLYKQRRADGSRPVLLDCEFIPAADASMTSSYSSYADYNDRMNVSSALISLNEDFIRGKFEVHQAGGIIEKDEVIQMGNGWSYKFNPNHATTDIAISQQMYVKYGTPVKVVAYFRKNSTYNGATRPFLFARGVYLGTVSQIMSTQNDQWERVELNFTPNRSEMVEISLRGEGTAGNFWVDPRVNVTTCDLDLIRGPYSTNLMFGLDEIYSGAGVSLGNVGL
jgi:hypothetical protein